MKELYEMIEEQIRLSGYTKEVDGEEFYDDISAEAENQENGTYVFVVKKTDTLSYQGCMTIMDEEFDLHYVDIIDGEDKFHVNFDV